MDANTWYLADGYDGTRVIKYDMAGKKLLQWGEKGAAGGQETRPSFWNNVHGIAVNPTNRRVYVNDRGNGRVQVFDENGKFLDSWKYQTQANAPSNIHTIYMGNDGKLWAADQTTHKMLGYDDKRQLRLFLGNLRHLRRLPLGRARLHGGYRRQPVDVVGARRPRAEVHSACGRQSGVPDCQAVGSEITRDSLGGATGRKKSVD